MSKIIDLFEKYIGTVEYEGIVETIQRWYWGSFVKEAWCATSESYFAKEAGILDKLGGKNCGVYEMGEACKKLHQNDGTFFEYPNLPETIKKHDIIFLERKGASHVTNAYETKKYVDSTASIKCLGGNQNDSICVKSYAMNKILYIYRPYDDEVWPSSSRPVIKYGYKDSYKGGTWCRQLQSILNSLGYHDPRGADLVLDGECGSKTSYAIKCFQEAHPLLEADGSCGPKTWSIIDVVLGTGTARAKITDDLNIRTSPNGAIKDVIKKGSVCNINAMQGKWCFVAEKTGWASSLFMELI